ncbi:hypothetical protein HDV01_001762 [Terramyces sp. JEL0728]|nr:hypothetical protein HDV01_001762 [Terramyces sp. JEL0728]
MASKKRKDQQELDDLVAAIEKLPEIHSSKCAAAVKKKAQTSAKNDAKLLTLLIEKDAKNGFGNVKGNLEKERQDAKKRLREKIKAARK